MRAQEEAKQVGEKSRYWLRKESESGTLISSDEIAQSF